MPIVLIAVVLYVAYEYLKHKKNGVLHSPGQVAQVGGRNFPGNQYDNGNAGTLAPVGPCDRPPAGSDLLYASNGGEYGELPTTRTPAPDSSDYLSIGGFLTLGGDSPEVP